MKLHELKPSEGSRKVRNRVGRGIGSGNGKTPVKVIKVKMLVLAAVYALVSKVVKCLYSNVFQNVVLQTSTVKITRS